MSENKIHHLEPQIYYYTFGPNKPALTVSSGDTVVAPTRDARGYDTGMQPIPEELKQRSDTTEFRESNPLVGPIYVEGAEVGDALAVHILRIALNRQYAWSRHIAHFGFFTGEGPGKELFLNEPIPEKLFDWNMFTSFTDAFGLRFASLTDDFVLRDFQENVAILELPNSKIGKVEIPQYKFCSQFRFSEQNKCIRLLAPYKFTIDLKCEKCYTIFKMQQKARSCYIFTTKWR